jgi:hypothetical protein
MIRNAIASDSATGNTFGFHASALPKRAVQTLVTFSAWLLPAAVPGALRVPLSILILAGAVYFCSRILARHREVDGSHWVNPFAEVLRWSLCCFILLYFRS